MLHLKLLAVAYANMLYNFLYKVILCNIVNNMKISLHSITSLMMQLSITFAYHETFPPTLIKKVIF